MGSNGPVRNESMMKSSEATAKIIASLDFISAVH